MHLYGISHKHPKDQLYIPLASDDELIGFGQPITQEVATEMVNAYLRLFLQVEELANELKTDEKYKDHAGFLALLRLLDRKKHVASGVFGKEIILQLIAQRECEGLRYTMGIDAAEKLTLILMAVKTTKDAAGIDQTRPSSVPGQSDRNVAKSEPVHMTVGPDLTLDNGSVLCGEVHNDSLNMEEAMELWSKLKAQREGFTEPPFSDVIFGSY